MRMTAGAYEAVFHLGEWYRQQRVQLPEVPFLDVVTYRFGIAQPEQHYHLPFKCTPWGYSCFRGGA
jgi:5-hydroxyisourate hydrolase